MSRPVITVENLSKAYRIGLKEEIPDTLVGAFSAWVQAPWQNLRRLSRLDTSRASLDGHQEDDILWALKDVSFEVQEGEVLGIIGRNGAGKSTLLKILSRITEPTSGRAIIRGRVSSLLEVGTGFHPELTGRENIYMNGTILGMTKREIDRKFDEIVDFSGVEKFLDTPIKRYSSGMKVRLAFAVAAHLEPEILIIDEVLAVGDAEFQRKCLGKMQDVARSGRTVLFVSHDLATIRTLCTRAIELHQGNIASQGTPEKTVNNYLHYIQQMAIKKLAERKDRRGNGEIIISNIIVRDSHNIIDRVCTGETTTIELQLRRQTPGCSLIYAAVSCYSADGIKLFHIDTDQQSTSRFNLAKAAKICFVIDHLPLPAGLYRLDALITESGGLADHIQAAHQFEVTEGDFYKNGKKINPYGSRFLVKHHVTSG